MKILVSQEIPPGREQREGGKRKVPGTFGSLRSLKLLRRNKLFLGVGRHQEESGIRPVWGVQKRREEEEKGGGEKRKEKGGKEGKEGEGKGGVGGWEYRSGRSAEQMYAFLLENLEKKNLKKF